MTQLCPTGCGRKRPTARIACARCWQRVPRHLQVLVNASQRTYRADFTDPDKLRAYNNAVADAIASVA